MRYLIRGESHNAEAVGVEGVPGSAAGALREVAPAAGRPAREVREPVGRFRRGRPGRRGAGRPVHDPLESASRKGWQDFQPAQVNNRHVSVVEGGERQRDAGVHLPRLEADVRSDRRHRRRGLHGQPGDERAVARAGLCRPGLDLRQRHGGCLRGRLSRRDGLDARRVRPADDAGSGMAARRWELGHVGRRELPHRLVADGAGPMADLAHGRGGLLAHPASRPPLQL